jgi:pimeloyl-ACP methyl ester carboxylesterase
MPLLSLLRILFAILSWLILGAAVWLLWEWYQGESLTTETGEVTTSRADWLLWTGIALLAWSFLGRFFWRLVLARPDHDQARPERRGGSIIAGADHGRLYVESSGPEDGLPVILTHGAAMDSTVWYLAREEFGEDFRVVAWDLPGLGRSKAQISLEHYADELAAVVRYVGRPSILVGHSMGGMTIQTLARRHPEMFGKDIIGVALLNTTHTNPLKTMILPRLAQALQPLLEIIFRIQIALFPLAWLSAWQSYLSGSTHIVNRIACGKGITRKQLDHISLLGTRNSPASIAKGNLAMLHWDATGAVANLSVPVLIIAGAGDIVTKPEASETIARTAVAPELHVIPGANHMSFLDHASTYHPLIEKLARDASSRASDLHVVPPTR